jgi:hypothetical protein
MKIGQLKVMVTLPLNLFLAKLRFFLGARKIDIHTPIENIPNKYVKEQLTKRRKVFQAAARKATSELENYELDINEANRHPLVTSTEGFPIEYYLIDKIFNAIKSGKPINLFTECKVESIEESNETEYKYKVHFFDSRTGKVSSIKAKSVIFSAGAIGSTEILLKSKKLKLSEKLGSKFSTNSNVFGVIYPTKEYLDAIQAPTVTSVAKFRSSSIKDLVYCIEDVSVPKMITRLIPEILDMIRKPILPNSDPIRSLLVNSKMGTQKTTERFFVLMPHQ